MNFEKIFFILKISLVTNSEWLEFGIKCKYLWDALVEIQKPSISCFPSLVIKGICENCVTIFAWDILRNNRVLFGITQAINHLVNFFIFLYHDLFVSCWTVKEQFELLKFIFIGIGIIEVVDWEDTLNKNDWRQQMGCEEPSSKLSAGFRS